MSDKTLNDLLPLSPDHNRERLETLKKLFPDKPDGDDEGEVHRRPDYAPGR